MSVSSIVPEKSRRNKKSDEEEEEVERHIFGRFGVTAVIFPHRLMYRCHATVCTVRGWGHSHNNEVGIRGIRLEISGMQFHTPCCH